MRRHLAAALVTALVLIAAPDRLRAQDVCTEPVTDDYRQAAAHVREAVDREDFVAALEILDVLEADYDYALIDYSRARALHRLQRYAQAEQAYSRFLHRAEDCQAIQDLLPTAQEYRSLAVQERRAELSAAEPEPVAEVPTEAVADPQAETDPLPEEVTPPTSADGRRTAGWVLVGSGGALIVAGVIHDIANSHLHDDARAAADAGDHEAYGDAVDAIDRARVVDYVLYGTGIAALGIGIALLLTADDPAEPPDAGVELGWAGGPWVGWHGEF